MPELTAVAMGDRMSSRQILSGIDIEHEAGP
jgi:hypothetical protein